MKLSRPELGRYVYARHQQLSAKRDVWTGFWQDLSLYVMPRHRNINSSSSSPDTYRDALLFDSTAIQANNTLASGQLDGMTPKTQRWFSFDPPAFFRGYEPIERWFKICTEISMLELARSNFYGIIHQVYLDRGGFGTAVATCEEGRRSLLTFRKFDIGSYCIAEDDEGHVDTLSYEFDLTARQAVQWFGRENLSEAVRQDFDDPGGDRKETSKTYIRHIFPRADDDIELGKRDALNMPIASVTIEKMGKHVVKVSGYEEQPFFASRYDRWGAQVYGWCPGAIALPEARQLNFLQKQMDALAEVTAFPRMLIPDTYKDEIDTRAHGVTYFDGSNPNLQPKEWLTGGKYDVGLDRVQQKQEAINKCFHVDLFRMFAELDKQMTAREVMERSAEKLTLFSPTFAQFTSEFINPMLTRVFRILLRGGRFPPVPRELIQRTREGPVMPEPEITYSSRIALAIKSLENASGANVLEIALPVSQIKPEVLDNINFDQWFRGMARNAGLPEGWLTSPEAMAAVREQRAKEQAAAQQQAQMLGMAEAASKVGSVKQDSVAGKALAGLLPQG